MIHGTDNSSSDRHGVSVVLRVTIPPFTETSSLCITLGAEALSVCQTPDADVANVEADGTILSPW